MNPVLQLPEAQVALREVPLAVPTTNENVTSFGSTNDQLPVHSPVFRIQKFPRQVRMPELPKENQRKETAVRPAAARPRVHAAKVRGKQSKGSQSGHVSPSPALFIQVAAAAPIPSLKEEQPVKSCPQSLAIIKAEQIIRGTGVQHITLHSPALAVSQPGTAIPIQSPTAFPPVPLQVQRPALSDLAASIHKRGVRKRPELEQPVPTEGATGAVRRLSTAERRVKIERYLQKKKKRKWSREVVYYSRKKSAERRIRVCGRFVNKATEIGIQHQDKSQSQTQQQQTTPRGKRREPEPAGEMQEPRRRQPKRAKKEPEKLGNTGRLPVLVRPIFAFVRTAPRTGHCLYSIS